MDSEDLTQCQADYNPLYVFNVQTETLKRAYADLIAARSLFIATLLPDGRVGSFYFTDCNSMLSQHLQTFALEDIKCTYNCTKKQEGKFFLI